MIRLTANKLKDWVNEKFKELEIVNYECTEIQRTFYTQDQYEAGACRLNILFKDRTLAVDHVANRHYFHCFYSLGYLQKAINNGYEMYLTYQFNAAHILNNLEIEVRKINPVELKTK